MVTPRKTTTQVDKTRSYLHGVANNLVNQIYGPDGPPWGTQFSELEQLALDIRQVLSEALLEEALQRQAQAQATLPQTLRCPTCGKETLSQEPEPRVLQSLAGTIDWEEPHTTCPSCRQAFFPSE